VYERILLAYDGSREGLVALREGALLAKRCRAQVFLLSVIPEAGGVALAQGANPDGLGPQIESYKALLARGVEVLGRLGLEPTAKLVKGEPVIQIGRFAEAIDADLVVLGHRRQSLLQRWWSGSTGAYVSDHVHCSILIGRKAISDEVFEAELVNGATLA